MALRLSQLDGRNGFRLDGAMGDGYDEGAVDGAGDVNGDGFDDLIIGSPAAGFYAGESFVVFGSADGFGASLDLATLDGENGFRLEGDRYDNSGDSVAGAGDVNDDGFDDLIIDGGGESFLVFGTADFEASLAFSELDGENGTILEGGSAAVADAGDVNGDGIDDLIVSAPWATPRKREGAGESYVVFGDANGFGERLDLTDLDGTNGFRIMGKRGDASGHSVAGAADINGDGLEDLIIGAPNARRKAGDTFVVFGSAAGFDARIDLADLDGTNGFRLKGVDRRDQSGDHVAGAGDVNGDGFADLIVSAPFANKNGDDDYTTGASYVIFGSASGFSRNIDLAALDGTNGFRVDGFTASYYSGVPVAGAGDVNGDGLDDLIFGDRNVNASYVMFGSAGDFAPSYDVASLNGAIGFRLEGITPSDPFQSGTAGSSVAGAGDVDGDGVDDLIIGAPQDRSAYGNHSFVVFGSEQLGGGNDAPSAADDVLHIASLAIVDLAADNGAGSDREPDLDDLTITAINGTPVTAGESILLASGLRVTLVDATEVRFDALGVAIGTVLSDSFVYEISDGRGASDTASVSVEYAQNVIDLSALNGANGFRAEGIDAKDYSGWSVAGAGDVNGDGFDDVIVGAPGADPGGRRNAGESYVLFGSAAGFDARFDVSALDGTTGFRIDGGSRADNPWGAGQSVAGAGDINDDGFDDLIIGDRGADPGGREGAGRTYVVFGSSGFEARVKLSDLDGTNGFRVDGIDSDDYSGRSVSGAGDVNGDGVDDLIIGAYGGDPKRKSDAGESYVVFGSPSGFDARVKLDRLDGENGFRIEGSEENDSSGASVAGAGDINDDGIDDLIIGAFFESYVVFGSAEGFERNIDLGALDGQNGFHLEFELSSSSGISVDRAGDINADGVDDLIVGAGGASYVVFGSPLGFEESVDLDALDGDDGFRIEDTARAASGGGAGAGDVDGDGIDDLILGGGSFYSYSGDAAYVVFGSASDFAPSLDLAALGAKGLRLTGVDPDSITNNNAFVAGAGDVNGDGLADVIIGAGDDSTGKDRAGETYVVFGVRTGPAPVFGGRDDDDLSGGVDADLIYGRAGNDVLAGLAGDDLLVGGAGWDALAGGDANDRLRGGGGRDRVDGGDGSDRLGGGASDDLLVGDAGGDLLDGGGGWDVLRGGAGKDTLFGGRGSDRLIGDGGRDKLIGDEGDDVLLGGADRDVFVFMSGFGSDRIGDFDADARGTQDRIDLRGLGITEAGFADAVTITDLGEDMEVAVEGHGTILCEDVSGEGGEDVIDVADFLLLA